jgi:hypothetical protein
VAYYTLVCGVSFSRRSVASKAHLQPFNERREPSSEHESQQPARKAYAAAIEKFTVPIERQHRLFVAKIKND